MRLLFTNVLATMLLLLGASVASAVNFTMTSNYDGVSVLQPSDTVTVSLFLNTEGALNLVVADVGVQFDGGILAYNEGASSMTSYLLYAMVPSGKTTITRWMEPLPNHVNGGSVDFYGGLDATPKIFLGTIPNLITTGYATPDFGGTLVASNNILLATIVFHVVGNGDGLGEIDVLMTTANAVAQIQGGVTVDISNTVTTTGSFAVYTPEPGTAIMVGLGLAGLAVAGKRRRA